MDDEERRRASEAYVESFPRYQAFADALRVLLSQLALQARIQVVSIDARAKDPSSLREKLGRRAQHYASLEDVPDLCGARVTTRYKSEIDQVEALVAGEFDVAERVVHGAESAESFGYTSTHLIVKLKTTRASLLEWSPFRDMQAEIQIRTILQHAWAMISHGLDYKSPLSVPADSRRTLFRVAALLETSDELFESYRSQIEIARQAYAEEAAREDDTWVELEINLDTVRTFWQRLPVEQVRTAAIEAGFTLPDAPLLADTDDASLSQLLTLLQRAGYETLGDLNSLMRALIDAPALLRSLVKELRLGDSDKRPYAVVPDVLTMAILEVRPEYVEHVDIHFPARWVQRWQAMAQDVVKESTQRKPEEPDVASHPVEDL